MNDRVEKALETLSALEGAVSPLVAPEALDILRSHIQQCRSEIASMADAIQGDDAEATEFDLGEAVKDRYHRLFMLAPEPYLVTDNRGMIREANLAAARFLGNDLRHVQGRPLANYFDAPTRARFLLKLRSMIPSDRVSLEARLHSRRGEEKYMVASGLMVIDDQSEDEAPRILWLLKDITDRVKAEEEVRQTNAFLEERVQQRTAELERTTEYLRKANAAKDEFLGLMSHELRTPLTVVLGNARILATRGDYIRDEDRRQAVSDIRIESERLQRIIENLMVLSKLSGERRPHPEPVLLQRLMDGLLKEMSQANSHRWIDVDVPADLPPAAGVPLYIEQIVRNLVNNAAKYSPQESPIRISIEAVGGGLTLRVRDHGPGLSSEELERVFEPFYRGPSAIEGQSGMGIGLTVCRRLAEAQGGDIWAESPPGGGASFVLRLPAWQEKRAPLSV